MRTWPNAKKQEWHNMIDTWAKKERNVKAEVGEGKHSEDFILGFELALRILANSRGTFGERLKNLVYPN